MSDPVEDVLIVGAGQGGLSASYHLTRAGIPHRIVDRGGIAHTWQAKRWDSFCLVTPNWTVNLPGRPYDGGDPDGFMSRDAFVAYMKDWAASFGAPVTGGVNVTRIVREGDIFRVRTGQGEMRVRSVIVATATYQYPRTPTVAAKLPSDICQLHAEAYKNPGQVRDGAILVVGSGQSGCQIVEDLLRTERETYLCVGRSGRLPRRYRGQDIICWQRELGLLERTPDMLDDPAHRFAGDPHVTGRDGGATVSLHDFGRRGVHLLGRFMDVDGRVLTLKDDLAVNLDFADRYCKDLIARIDAFIDEKGFDAPPHGGGVPGGPVPGQRAPSSPARLGLDAAGIRTVIWATGFAFDFSWIAGVPVDRQGYPVTKGGASPMKGLFFCGLNWMTKRKSGILYGVDEDARLVADRVASYLEGRTVRKVG